MGTSRTDECHKDAVRIALTSGLSRHRVVDVRSTDPGIHHGAQIRSIVMWN